MKKSDLSSVALAKDGNITKTDLTQAIGQAVGELKNYTDQSINKAVGELKNYTDQSINKAVGELKSYADQRSEEILQAISQFSTEVDQRLINLEDGQEAIKLMLDNVPYRFELADLDKRVKLLES